MAGLPRKSKVGTRDNSARIDTATYFIATRMERAGTLRRGQALMLAATLPDSTKPPARGKSKRGRA